MKRRSQYLERHEWLSSITKYCACQDKWQAKITKQSPKTAPHMNNNPRPPNRVTKQCTNHEQWQAKTTKHSPCHQNWQANPAVTLLELVLDWTRTFTELVLDWTHTWLSQDWAKLWLDWKWLLDWTNASLKCYCAELWLHWTLRVWKTWYIGILSTKLPLHTRYWHNSCETHCQSWHESSTPRKATGVTATSDLVTKSWTGNLQSMLRQTVATWLFCYRQVWLSKVALESDLGCYLKKKTWVYMFLIWSFALKWKDLVLNCLFPW